MTEIIKLHLLPDIAVGLNHLCLTDPVFKTQKISYNNFSWIYRGNGFKTLLRIIVGQQLSMKAAAAVWTKVSNAFEEITPDAVINRPDKELRALGLSHQKISYIKILSQAVIDGLIDFEKLNIQDSDAVRSSLTSLKGIGPWTANMYLMFGLGRSDVWAPGDLGIREGLRRYLSQEIRPTIVETEVHRQTFAPHLTAASLLLWTLAGDKTQD